MTHTKLKIATLIAAGLAFGSTSALALDGKVVLDQLVKKGVLTPEEADAIIKKDNEKKKADPAPVVVQEKNPDVSEIKITGGVQADGKYTYHHNGSPGSNANLTPGSGFELRRFQLGAEAKIGSSWTVFGQIEGDAGNNGTNSNGNTAATSVGPNGQNGVQLTNGSRYDFIIDKAGISYDTGDYGKITAGVMKTKFDFEEYTSSFDIYTIERSPNAFYFGSYYETGANGSKTALNGNLTIGGRKVGLYYDKAPGKEGGFGWGAGVSNAYEDSFTSQTNPTNENYCPEFYANVAYKLNIGENSSLETGLNFAYTDANTAQISDSTNAAGTNGSSISSPLVGNTSTNADYDTTTTAFEWITTYKTGKLTVIGDVMTAYVQNGRYQNNYTAGHADTAMPLAVTATAAYRVTDEIEPVVQFGYLETDGRGVQEGGVVRDYNNTSAVAYDRAYNVFAGVNWYITPKSLMIKAGFEETHFDGHGHGVAAAAQNSADDYGVRVRLQARF